MRQPDEPGVPVPPPAQPTRELLLAQALDACITAERRLPGSSQEIIARQPAWARGELQRLVGLAGSLDAATSNAIMSSEFRVAARARLMQRIGGDPNPPETREGFVDAPAAPAPRVSRPPGVAALSMVSSSPSSATSPRRRAVWVWRAAASLVAAVLAGAATLTASASALPGEPLYGLKEVREDLAVRLATNDQQRTLLLLQQANARLDETARLLAQGRTVDATLTTQRYDQVVQRATTSYVGSIDDERLASAPATVNVEASLSQDQDQLQALLQSAPEPARADLREALVATERGRALVAELRLVELPLERADREPTSPPIAAPVATTAVEDGSTDTHNTSPTAVPTVQVKNPTAVPTRLPALALSTPTPAAVVADARDDAAQTDIAPPVVAQVSGSTSRGSGTDGSGGSSGSEAAPAVSSASSGDELANAPDGSFEPEAHNGGGGDHSQVDRADVAALARGRTAASPLGGQPDRTDRRQDLEPAAVMRQSQEATTVRSAPAQVVTIGPERASTPNSSSTSNASDLIARYNRGEVRMSPATQVVATRPPSTSASTASQTATSSAQSTSTSAQTASTSSQTSSSSAQSTSTSAQTASTASQTLSTSSQATSISSQTSSTSASAVTTKSGSTSLAPALRTTSGERSTTDSSHPAQ